MITRLLPLLLKEKGTGDEVKERKGG